MRSSSRDFVSVVIQGDGGLAPTGDGFHLHQSKQVLALGGFWGSMNQEEPPIEDPSAWQLPASRTDFIFVMIGEKLGFFGCVAVMILYAILMEITADGAVNAGSLWSARYHRHCYADECSDHSEHRHDGWPAANHRDNSSVVQLWRKQSPDDLCSDWTDHEHRDSS